MFLGQDNTKDFTARGLFNYLTEDTDINSLSEPEVRLLNALPTIASELHQGRFNQERGCAMCGQPHDFKGCPILNNHESLQQLYVKLHLAVSKFLRLFGHKHLVTIPVSSLKFVPIQDVEEVLPTKIPINTVSTQISSVHRNGSPRRSPSKKGSSSLVNHMTKLAEDRPSQSLGATMATVNHLSGVVKDTKQDVQNIWSHLNSLSSSGPGLHQGVESQSTDEDSDDSAPVNSFQLNLLNFLQGDPRNN